jgi:hypothetical protein
MRSRFALVVLVAVAASARAQLNGSATLVNTPVGGGQYSNTISIQNSGTTTIGTFWFAWIPGLDFLPSLPGNVTSPAGWSYQVVHSAGYSIEWTANSPASYLAAGGSLSGFGFASADSASVLSNLTPVYSRPYFTTESFFYSGAPLLGQSLDFIVNVVPAPSGVALALVAGSFLGRRRRA